MDEDTAIDRLITDICEQALDDYRRGPTRANRQHYTTALAFFEALGLRAQVDWRLRVRALPAAHVALEQPQPDVAPLDQLVLWAERQALPALV